MAAMLLHGTLDATIFEAKFNMPVSKFLVGLIPRIDGVPTGLPQLYATVDLARARVGRTRVVDDDPSNPRWDESFRIYCAHSTADVVFSVKAALPIDAALVGRAYLPVQDLLKASGGEAVIDRWLDILDEGMMPLLHGPKIHVRVSFTAVAADPGWGRGVGGVAPFAGVPKTFFKQREGCRVTLYQDAHVPDTFRPPGIIQLAGGRPYERPRCWEDVYDAVAGAKHVVYVTGWSVFPEITLVRDGGRRRPEAGGETLGELLKRKADEGVRVLMLVWDDPTSVLNLGLVDGQMKTNDANTLRYFKGSGVRCVLCPREPDDAASFAEGLKTFAFSHHQKCVVVDVAGAGGDARRRIVSFVGGLDLTNGRYDTPEHSLFRTLNTAHSNDFYQGNLPGASLAAGGPREPWHDIHCRIEGPAAWDVLHNFEQRWRKQGGGNDGGLLPILPFPWKSPKDDVLVDLRGMEDVIAPQSTPAAPAAGNAESWNVQVFRSTDSSACEGFGKTPAEAAQSGLVSGKDHVIERSIQDAYIHAIRRAKRFIYIENQYFLGSSFGWLPDGGVTPANINALHLIPRELSLKIVSKIEAGEPFAVYVVVPMWPEGDPSSWNVQAILHWQRKTMEMMYADIAVALKAKGLDGADPKDYLSFFCLGNRETKLPREYEPRSHPLRGSDYDRAQKARRTMVYVHSKLMIVDDEYIIVGSANINERSMNGGRDTEIAMGAYQPAHLNGGNGKVARGQVHGFRMSLWYEHLAELREEFKDPGSLKCVRAVNRMAGEFWRRYTADEVTDLRGHLLSYPIDVKRDGTVAALPGVEFFPDTVAPVLGGLSVLVNVGSPLTNFVLST